ncbi:MAG: sigma-54 dependent transcriptional regulator [Acidihalobacter sp.]
MPDNAHVMFVDDEPHIRIAAQQTLELADLRLNGYETAEAALRELSPGFTGVLVCDIRLPGMDGMEFLRRALEIDPELPVVLVTGHGDISMAVGAMHEGAYDFLEKPYTPERLTEVVRRALDKRALTLENRALRRELEEHNTPGPRIIGSSPSIQRLRGLIRQVADADADVLIFGETGTGKELVARSLHELSRRRTGNFVALNCGAMPEQLMESELFGHEAGAFTGARGRRLGKLEHASGGTLFLDEIESMPMAMQVRLLRVLQERSLERLGSNQTVPLDLRVLAATKVDLREAADRGEFREDLYYRLNVVTLEIPPLRSATAARTFLCCSSISPWSPAHASARRPRRSPPPSCRPCSRTPGPATCASCATPPSATSCSASSSISTSAVWCTPRPNTAP